MVKDIVKQKNLNFGELTISECVEIASEAKVKFSDVVIEEAMAVNQLTREEVLEKVLGSFEHNMNAAEVGVTSGKSFLMGTVGQDLKKGEAKLVNDSFVNKVLMYTLGAQVGNHDIGLMPCAGTGDSCPYTGFVKSMLEEGIDRTKVGEVASVVLKIGTMFRVGKTSTGCNMEGYGAGSAALSAGFVELEGGSPEQVERAIVLAISPTIANPCTPRVMVPGLCATHIGGAVMNGRLASSLAMYTSIPVNVKADVMLAMAAQAHLASAKAVVPIVIEYMESFFKTNAGVEHFIDDETKGQEKARKEATLSRAHEEARQLAKKANSIVKPFGMAVVGGSSQAVGSPTNAGRLVHRLAKGKISKVLIELYPELFARRGINVPGILMAAVYGSTTEDGAMYSQVMEKVKSEGIEVEILQVDEPQLQKVTVFASEKNGMVKTLNRGGARLVLQDASEDLEDVRKIAKELGIEIVE